MPVRPRRRKPKRHLLHPLRYATPEVLASVTKIVALVAAAAAPSAIVSQQSAHKVEASEERVGYANANTNAALGIVTMLAGQIDSLRWEVATLRREQAESRLRERQTAARLPENMVGPAVPVSWEIKPPKKRWQFWRG